tara:strand:- start:225 stop:608 length:384 start_codon:yes stop_codon:yes gene_type:complete
MEIWKTTKESDSYEVSNYGRVRSKDRIVYRKGHKMMLKGKILSQGTAKKCGHRYVNFYKDSKYKTHYVHRLVLINFEGDPPSPEMQCAHYDCNADNNHIDNLRWATQTENNLDSTRMGKPCGPKRKI